MPAALVPLGVASYAMTVYNFIIYLIKPKGN
jgi:hypothetical protein